MCDVSIPEYRVNDEKTGCVKCTDDEVFDTVTKNCVKREEGSDKVSFGEWKDKMLTSKMIKGPDIHGQMMVLQGKLLLKKRKAGEQAKMYEQKTDPTYPDDNILQLLNINDIDAETYQINLRVQESHE